MIQNWKQTSVTLQPGMVNAYTPLAGGNIFQILNRTAAGGGAVYVDDNSNPMVSDTYYALKVEQGNTGAVVRPYKPSMIYLYTDAGSPLTITIIEIVSEDLSFVFNASQVLQIQGNVQVAQPVQISGTVAVSGDVEVKNDSGNPIPVSGTLTADPSSRSYAQKNASALIKTGAAVLERIIVTKADAGSTVTVYDGTSGAGTVLAVIDSESVTGTLDFGADVSSGIYLDIAGGSPEVTVVYR